ncbi:hypothetical protein [Campylobacter phage CJLB-7]|nr:hypothetical protein [Campylobacter phage CJLB-7]
MELEVWKGKHSVLLNKLYNDNNYVYDSDIIDVLVYKCLNQPKYITNDEARFLFFKKYFSEVCSEIDSSFKCPYCNEMNNIKFTDDDISITEYSLEPIEINVDNIIVTIYFKKELSQDDSLCLIAETKNMIDHEKRLLELYYMIDYISINGEELRGNHIIFEKYINELPLSCFNRVFDYFRDSIPKHSIIKSCSCKNCNSEINVELKELPESVRRNLF